MARFGWTDPDTDLDDDEATLWTAGVNLYHHDHVKTGGTGQLCRSMAT